ncbi:MAG: penicillin-binding protein 2 [Acidobacteriota bacterium]|nr:penicillin-binding protein 2 [Acidobacteriota bacterium]
MKHRLVLFLAVLVLWGGAISARLYKVQVLEHGRYADRAEDQQHRIVEVHPPRGTIFDARGRILAVSVAVDSACVFPHELNRHKDPEGILRQIAERAGVDPEALSKRVARNSNFAWVRRLLEPEQAQALRDLGIDGLGFVEESKRYYPLAEIAGQVLGFVGTDHTGLAGIEAQYEQAISGTPVNRTVIRDGLKRRVHAPGLSLSDADPGADLHLTIDSSIQYIVERELAKAVDLHQAKSGTAVVLDPKTGAVLAMASQPTFDPNRFGEFERELWRNPAIQDAYEPGSTFKLVTFAAALDRDLIDPVDVVDCEMGLIDLGRVEIRDHKEFGELTFRDVFAFSSNVGSIKAGLLVGRQGLFDQTLAFGFGSGTGVDLPGEAGGLLRSAESWWPNQEAYVSIGQGLSVTPLQVAAAFAAIANDGELVKPYLMAEQGIRLERRALHPKPSVVRRVASTSTVRTLVRLLEAVVEEGTGQLAAIPGYVVAGKTGTAQKAGDGGYAADKHVASFAGFVPSRDPVLAAVVVIDEPRGRFHGGEVAAPVFSAIARQSLVYLGSAPDPSAMKRRLESRS